MKKSIICIAILTTLLASCTKAPFWCPIPGGGGGNSNTMKVNLTVPTDIYPQMLYGGQQNTSQAKFIIAVTGNTTDTLRLPDLPFYDSLGHTAAMANRLNNPILTDGINQWFGTISSAGIVSFSGINLKIPAGSSRTFILKTDVNAVTDMADDTVKFQWKIKITPAVATATGISVSQQSSIPPVGKLQMIVHGVPVIAKTNVTPTNIEFARFDVTAHGNRLRVKELDATLFNVQSSQSVEIYANGIGGTLVYSGPYSTHMVFNQSPGYTEVLNGNTITFSVKVVNPIATSSGGTANPMSIRLDNIVYDDVLNDGNVTVNNTNAFKNTGNWPFTWSQ